METKEWTYRSERSEDSKDRHPWPDGPWMSEPDKVQWPDEATGLACLAVRGPMGSWCGYVGVGKAHPLYGIEYNGCIEKCGKVKTFGSLTQELRDNAEPDSPFKELPDPSPRLAADIVKDCDHTSPDSIFDVHGGLTFSKFCAEDDKERGVCHIAEPGEEEPLWWFGFDTAHAWDLVPGMIRVHEEFVRDYPDSALRQTEVYRPLEYVKDEVTNLARQVADYQPA